MHEKILEEIGLTRNEAIIYLSLLKLGSAPVSKISNLSGLNRANMYNTINSLIKKGAISYVIKNNVKYFMAAKPERLLDFLKEKEDKLSAILPELEKIEKTTSKIDVEIFEGKEGVKTFYMYLSRTNKEVVGFGITGLAYDILQYYAPKILKQLSEKVHARYIAFDKTRKKEIIKLKNTEYRYFPKDVDNFATTLIYDEYTAIISYETIPKVVVIKDKSISDGYRKYFEFMWKLAKS
jgi:sugar-specific transcriptional regulator TrmB